MLISNKEKNINIANDIMERKNANYLIINFTDDFENILTKINYKFSLFMEGVERGIKIFDLPNEEDDVIDFYSYKELFFSLLNENGYKIKIFDIANMQYSFHYNPLKYIFNDTSANNLINDFIASTNRINNKTQNTNLYFEDAEKFIYIALSSLLRESYQDNFASIADILGKGSLHLNEFFLNHLESSESAQKYYKAFCNKKLPKRTVDNVFRSCIERLKPFLNEDLRNLTSFDEMELDKISSEKIALFVVNPTAIKPYSFLSEMLFHQISHLNVLQLPINYMFNPLFYFKQREIKIHKDLKNLHDDFYNEISLYRL